jgi:hypothetical protein
MTTTAAHPALPVANVRPFVLAGDARFTVTSKASGVRFTFRVQRAPRREGDSDNRAAGRPWFVKVLTGADNESDYRYLGCVYARDDEPTSYRHGAKSRIGADAPSAKAAAWFFGNLARGYVSPACEVHHEGRCGRCGRALTVPESIESGFGPVCIDLVL